MIVTHSNNYFIEWLNMYVMSINRNSPDEKVYVSGANFTDEQIVFLKSLHDKIIIKNHVTDKIIDILELRRFMQNRVSKVMLEAYNSGLDNMYMVTNADVMVMRPLDNLYDLMKECDVALHFTNSHMRVKQIQNGVMAFNVGNPKVLDFLKYHDEIIWTRKIVKGSGQRRLFELHKKYENKLKFGAIPHDYIDGRCRRNSHMWSGHRKGKWLAFQKYQRALGLPVSEELPDWWHPTELIAAEAENSNE